MNINKFTRVVVRIPQYDNTVTSLSLTQAIKLLL